jgi:hypothetical protein
MNKQIVDLYEQASSFASEEENPTKSYKDRVMIKFAQLIAAECISVVATLSPNYPLRYKNNLLIEINHRDQIEELFRGDCVEEIKQHFGLEVND